VIIQWRGTCGHPGILADGGAEKKAPSTVNAWGKGFRRFARRYERLGCSNFMAASSPVLVRRPDAGAPSARNIFALSNERSPYFAWLVLRSFVLALLRYCRSSFDHRARPHPRFVRLGMCCPLTALALHSRSRRLSMPSLPSPRRNWLREQNRQMMSWNCYRLRRRQNLRSHLHHHLRPERAQG